MTPIPVIGVLVYNRGDLLVRMVESIDYPVEKLVIVFNGVDQSVADAAERIRTIRPDVITFNPGFEKPHAVNLGCSGGWNWLLKNHMADWILLVGNDIQFHTGQLAKVAAHYEKHSKDQPPIALVTTNYGWNVCGITRYGVEVLGYFDENITPAYYEDCDYNWRHNIAQRQKLVSYPVEGECIINVHHDASSTAKNLPPDRYERLCKAFERNVEYYIRKWGGAQTHELWDSPFNNPAFSIRDWSLELGREELNRLI